MSELIKLLCEYGTLGTLVISILTYIGTISLKKSQQKVSIMATKRSQRIDLMREYSAGVISCGKQFLHNFATESTKNELVCYVNKFNSLLQYAYLHDIKLIDYANRIIELCLASKVETADLQATLYNFWKECDRYVGVEYERLKNESTGHIKRSGAVQDEEEIFEQIYQRIVKKEKAALAAKEKAEAEQQATEKQ